MMIFPFSSWFLKFQPLKSTPRIGGAKGTILLGPGEAGTGPGSVPSAPNSSPGTCLQLQDAELDVNQQLDNEQAPLLGMRNSLLQSGETGGIKLSERALGRRQWFDKIKKKKSWRKWILPFSLFVMDLIGSLAPVWVCPGNLSRVTFVPPAAKTRKPCSCPRAFMVEHKVKVKGRAKKPQFRICFFTPFGERILSLLTFSFVSSLLDEIPE